MSTVVTLPELGESVVEGTVSRWLVKVGDRVELDQSLIEVTTDKVDVEIPSPAAGVIEEILVGEGETVPVGAELARIDGQAKPAEAGAGDAPAARVPAPPAARVVAPPAARVADPTAGAEAPEAVRATPVARRMADEQGVDLRQVQGTGASGKVTRRDVLEHRPEPAPAPPPVAADPPASPAPSPRPASSPRRAIARPATAAGPAPPAGDAPRPAFMDYRLQEGDRVVPMTPLRRLVADHMVFSKRTSPHVGTVAEIDLGGVVRIRDAQKRAFREAHGFGLSFLPFVVHASVRALREFPRLNASVLEDAIVEKRDIHIGVAVETDKGLVVPVVRHADRLSLAGLAQAVEDIANRARTRRLSADELKGGTFTVSNPGRNGNLYGFAIINQPQVGILRMGEVVKRPVVRSIDGQDAIAIRPIMHLALSYDHRAVDGSPANGFLFRIRELLEEAEFDL